jgi:hypothetical protein
MDGQTQHPGAYARITGISGLAILLNRLTFLSVARTSVFAYLLHLAFTLLRVLLYRVLPTFVPTTNNVLALMFCSEFDADAALSTPGPTTWCATIDSQFSRVYFMPLLHFTYIL